MTPHDIKQRLVKAVKSDNLYEGTAELADELEKAGASVAVVEPILRFMEDHPREEYGAPGPLVHFVERFYRHGYEEELLKSLQRKPTVHTLWMLNRLVNGAKNDAQRSHYLDFFRQALTHSEADKETRETAADYLELQE